MDALHLSLWNGNRSSIIFYSCLKVAHYIFVFFLFIIYSTAIQVLYSRRDDAARTRRRWKWSPSVVPGPYSTCLITIKELAISSRPTRAVADLRVTCELLAPPPLSILLATNHELMVLLTEQAIHPSVIFKVKRTEIC